MRGAARAAVAGALAAAAVLGACRREPPPVQPPPLTVARPEGVVPSDPIYSGPITDAAPVTATEPWAREAGAGVRRGDVPEVSPVTAAFLDAPGKVDGGLCTRLLIADVRGKLAAAGEALTPGDVLVVEHVPAVEVEGSGLAVVARYDMAPEVCVPKARPAPKKALVRAGESPELVWAGGKMTAHLDVGARISPQVYMGRLAGTAAVPEHVHRPSWEILAAVDASGTFTLAGEEHRLGPKQVVVVPPGTPHAWRPDPGSKLVAIQMYSPPGPEQRFVALAASERDGGARVVDAGAKAR